MTRVTATEQGTRPVPALLRRHRAALLLLLLLGTSWALLAAADPVSGVPAAWPAAGLLTGLLVITERQHRVGVSAVAGALIVLAHLLVGDATLIAFGSAVSSVAGTWVAWWRLRRGLGSRRVGLVEEGDVSRLIAAASLGSVVSTVGVAVTLLVAGVGNPLLAMVAVFGTHAPGSAAGRCSPTSAPPRSRPGTTATSGTSGGPTARAAPSHWPSPR